VRPATSRDIPALTALIDASVRGLSTGYYGAEQIDASLRHMFGVDSQLIGDGTYYVIEDAAAIVAGGGWSARRTLFGGDQFKEGEDTHLDPATDAARIRAFFVHPSQARRGLGRRLFTRCAAEAWAAGFRRLELVATLPGVPLYEALGFTAVRPIIVLLPGGVEIETVLMGRPLSRGES
jgi:GNAT superfamily N-acetyltransferase